MLSREDCIVPDWPAPKNVHALLTTRTGGVSQGNLASLNLGKSVGDDPLAVAENRRRVEALVGYPPRWMSQVHGTEVALLEQNSANESITADAAVTRSIGSVCAVMVADCLPVIFTDNAGTVVAAAHAGWRGMANSVLEATIASMNVSPANITAYMGPAIGPTQFEVGEDVREAFISKSRIAEAAFQPRLGGATGKYNADIYALAIERMCAAGIPVAQIFGGGFCTVNDPARFFSYRREAKTGQKSGRMAALVWMT